jgi:GNAT superfamily N-acetyltransferase
VVSVPEASESALRFALTRGFVEVRRSWHQVLDVQSFMDEGWLEVDGYEVRSYLEIADERQLFELYRVTSRDVPGATKLPSFDEYRQRTLESPLCLPGAYFVALRDHRWVAYTGTRQRALDRPLEWHTGMTGVLRAHRGRGLAMALKRRVIALARACGIRELHTNNDSSNAPMLEVNRKLGYRRCSGVIQLERSV